MFHALPIALALVAQAAPERPGSSPIDLVSALETVLADAIARGEPSVVAIARDKEGRGEETLAIKGRNPAPPPVPAGGGGIFGGADLLGEDPVSFDYGSGVVVGDEGQILTAYHVVQGASRLQIKAAGRQFFDAEIIAADPRSDLAVIVPREGRGIPRPKLTPLPLGDATKLRKGSFLVALGNPYNAARDGTASASWGILANLARRMEPTARDDPRKLQLRHYPTLLQLDSKLNIGMSGGAVVNMRGELVGLTTGAANASGFDAQAGYAVPVDALGRRVIDRLIQGKEAEYGFLGIGLPTDPKILKTNLVDNVQPGTPASDGGLVVGDEIVSVGGLAVIDARSLVAAVNTFTPGVPIRLEIVRDGERLTKTIVLSKFPLTGEVIATNRDAPWRGLRVDYLSMLPNGELGADLLRAMAKGGVGIVEVIPGSPADAAGLRAGQIILEVGGRPVKTPAEFARAVSGREGPVDLSTESERKVTIK